MTLRNLHNRHAREHPLFVFRSIGKFANGLLPQDLKVDPRLKLLQEPGVRIRKDAIYRIIWVFPRERLEQVVAFADALQAWLADPCNHFQVISCGPPQAADLELLRREAPLDISCSELCLDFHTPFKHSPRHSPPSAHEQLWRLDPSRLRDWFTSSAARLLGEATPEPPELPDLRILSWFWDFQRFGHLPKSPNGSPRENVMGFTGPLYLRGPWPEWEPWLRLASEFLVGGGTTCGQGAFHLRQHRTFFDRLLPDLTRYEAAWHRHVEEDDRDEEASHALTDPKELAAELAGELTAGCHRPRPARIFDIPKPKGGFRRIALLADRDAIVQRALHEILCPVLDRALEPASIGFRPGKSVGSARDLVAKALIAGCDHVVESDLADFFDEIPWDGLEHALERQLPLADVQTRAALMAIARTPLLNHSRPIPGRDRGILQGSPLSPLLANLFLDDLDEKMLAAGHHFIRYGDDFVILTSGAAAASAVLEELRNHVTKLGLSLKEEKTAIREVALGFRFLGMELGGEAGADLIERSALRRPVIIRSQYGFAGVDHDALIVKKDQKILARVPLARVGQLIFHGNFALSTRLLGICSKRRIPVTLCSAAGHHENTLRPDSREHYALIGRHAAAHAGLDPAGRLAIATLAILAKLHNHGMWLSSLPQPVARQAAAEIRRILQRMKTSQPANADALFGHEGIGAHTAFQAINTLVIDETFRSRCRKPHDKPDAWNALLDFGYSQLFSHLNVLVRAEGLNPYLGFLHSPDDRFESLVADLQEPFRPRIDRWAVRTVNLGTLRPDQLDSDGETWRIHYEAYPALLESFARELQTRHAGDAGTFADLILGQVLVIREWAEQDRHPRFYQQS